MRVLMLNNEFPPLGGGTGTANRFILQYLASVPGLEIDLITSARGKVEQNESFAPNIQIYKLPVNNKNIHHSSNIELIRYAVRGFLFAIQIQRKRRYDLCLAWSALPAGAVALLLRILTGLRYIVRVGGPDIPGFERRYRMIYPLLSPFIRAIWYGSEKVIAKSHGEVEMIRRINRNANCAVINNGVDVSLFKPRDRRDPNETLRLVCVGRLIERKGQRYLIESVKSLIEEGIDVNVDLIGTGDARESYESQVKALRLTDHVKFLGYVPREEISRYYTAAHIFVLPSYNEGMSVAMLEAMASGLPVVVTPTAGTAELVDAGVNGLFFQWGDVTQLTRHIRQLEQDRSLISRMGAASRAKAEHYSWEQAASQYQEMFRAIISGELHPRASQQPVRADTK